MIQTVHDKKKDVIFLIFLGNNIFWSRIGSHLGKEWRKFTKKRWGIIKVNSSYDNMSVLHLITGNLSFNRNLKSRQTMSTTGSEAAWVTMHPLYWILTNTLKNFQICHCKLINIYSVILCSVSIFDFVSIIIASNWCPNKF